jgi:Arylsulfotransferase (ASST)
MVSFRHLDAIYRIKRTDGSIAWKLGGTTRPESLHVLNDPLSTGEDVFHGQHDARVLGDGTVTVHDNGFHPAAQRPPRAVRFAIDADARTATLVEQKTDPGPPLTAFCCGSARRLPGGNWVMAWGSSELITEVSAAGERITSLQFEGHTFSYRVHPVPFGRLSAAALRAGMDAQYPRAAVRSESAPALWVSLVPAFENCTSPNLTHGAPLEYGSCNPPVPTSDFLTVGTPDSNGARSNFMGIVSYRAQPGDPSTTQSEADGTIDVRLTDVRREDDLSDYTGRATTSWLAPRHRPWQRPVRKRACDWSGLRVPGCGSLRRNAGSGRRRDLFGIHDVQCSRSGDGRRRQGDELGARNDRGLRRRRSRRGRRPRLNPLRGSRAVYAVTAARP